jgi:hypothetical protein
LIFTVHKSDTPSMPEYSAYKAFSKSNTLNFDQVYRKVYPHLQYQTPTI